MKFAPIALFTYNRPRHTRQTVEALKQNELSNQSDLYVFSDGAKSVSERGKVTEVRNYINGIEGFRSLNIIEHQDNLGLAESIITGVTEVVNKYGRIIVLEDDLLTSPFFLHYMNDALEHYEHEDKVISIQGYIFPVSDKLPTTFFLRWTDCWGWGTWKRGWRLFEKDGSKLLGELKRKGLEREFDIDGTWRYLRMLKDQIAGRNSSWAIRWYASAFLNGRLNLFPHASLVQHIGSDGSGSHIANGCDIFDVNLAKDPIPVESIPIAENLEARRIVANYLRSTKTPFIKAILNRLAKCPWKVNIGMIERKGNETLRIIQSELSWLKRMRVCLGRLVRLFFWPLDRILAPNCRGKVFPPSGAQTFMSYSRPAPEINKLPPGFVVSRMRVRDLRVWFMLMNKSELVWSFCLDGLVKFILDPRFSRYPTFLVWRGSQLVASASLWDKKSNSKRIRMVHMVAVDPETRGMGLGTHVTCLVIDYVRNVLNIQESICLQASGIPAQRLYEKIGFSVVSGPEVAH